MVGHVSSFFQRSSDGSNPTSALCPLLCFPTHFAQHGAGGLEIITGKQCVFYYGK
jgi:hypothetical protein